MNKLSLLFWSFIVVLGAFLFNQVGQWAGGPQWYQKEAWLVFMLIVFLVYIILMVQAAEYLVTALFFIGMALYVVVPSAIAFYSAYFLASNVPTVKEIVVLSIFIVIFSLVAGLIRQGQVDKRKLLPGD